MGHPPLRPGRADVGRARLRAAWVPEFEPDDDPGRLAPQHALYAPLYSADGELLGNMAVDLPPDGRVPNEPDRELLEMFAVQAGVALSNARERERLTERVRLDRMLKAVAAAGTQQSLSEALGTAVVAVAECLRPVQAWVRCFPNEGRRRRAHGRHAADRCCPTRTVPEIRARPDSARDCLVLPIQLGVDDPVVTASCPRVASTLQEVMAGIASTASLVVPLASQDELVGYPCSASPARARPDGRRGRRPVRGRSPAGADRRARRACSRPSSGSSRSSASSPATAAS